MDPKTILKLFPFLRKYKKALLPVYMEYLKWRSRKSIFRPHDFHSDGGRTASGRLYDKTEAMPFELEERSELYDIFLNNDSGVSIHKWHHYFPIYERHFSRFRGKKTVIVEIGVDQGGSTKLWKNYFGPQCEVHGVDIDPKCAKFSDPENGIYIHIGDQADEAFLDILMDSAGTPDIFIDDGGHTMNQQITTFLRCYERLSENGVYLCEDMHTSLMPWFIDCGENFIDFAKKHIDLLYAWYAPPYNLLDYMGDDVNPPEMPRIPRFASITSGIHFYDSVVVFERGEKCVPHSQRI